jgi:hypothetical protein
MNKVMQRIIKYKNDVLKNGYSAKFLLISDDNLDVLMKEINEIMSSNNSVKVIKPEYFIGMKVLTVYGNNRLEVTSNKPCARCLNECNDSGICQEQFCYMHPRLMNDDKL